MKIFFNYIHFVGKKTAAKFFVILRLFFCSERLRNVSAFLFFRLSGVRMSQNLINIGADSIQFFLLISVVMVGFQCLFFLLEQLVLFCFQ